MSDKKPVHFVRVHTVDDDVVVLTYECVVQHARTE
jgi:hypothetical protein